MRGLSSDVVRDGWFNVVVSGWIRFSLIYIVARLYIGCVRAAHFWRYKRALTVQGAALLHQQSGDDVIVFCSVTSLALTRAQDFEVRHDMLIALIAPKYAS